MKRIFLALILSTAVSSPTPASSAAAGTYDTLVHLNNALRGLGGEDVSRLISAEYARIMPRQWSAEEADNEFLTDIFKSTALVHIYTADPEQATLLVTLHDQLHDRGITDSWMTATTYEALIRSRLLDVAGTFARNNAIDPTDTVLALSKQVIELPDLAGTTQLIRIDSPSEASLVPVNLSVPSLVAVVHPLCGPSRRALAAIEKDPGLAWMKQHLQLLVPPEGSFPT